MPAVRHRRSQNALVDEVMAVVDALMRISSRTEGEFGSPAAEFFDNAVVRYCLADYWCEILRPEPEQVNGSGRFGKAPTNPLAINPYSAHDFTTGLPTDGLSAIRKLSRKGGRVIPAKCDLWKCLNLGIQSTAHVLAPPTFEASCTCTEAHSSSDALATRHSFFTRKRFSKFPV